MYAMSQRCANALCMVDSPDSRERYQIHIVDFSPRLSPDAVLMLAQRRRRWAIALALGGDILVNSACYI